MGNPAEIPASPAKGYGTILVGTVLWSTAAVFIRYLTENYSMPPLVLAFWREVGVAAGLLIALLLLKPRLLILSRRHLPFFALYGLILMTFNVMLTFSFARNGAAISTVLVYSSPAFTAVLAWRLWGERLDALKITAVGLSLAGCIFVSGAFDPEVWDVNPAGIILGLISGLLFALYSIFGKEALHRGINPWTSLTYTFSAAPVFLLVLLLLSPGDSRHLNLGSFDQLLWLDTWRGLGVVVLLALGPTIGGYGLYSVGMRSLPASVANLLVSTEPIFTTLFAYLFLGERLLPEQMAGSVLIMVGVVLLRLRNAGGARISLFRRRTPRSQ